MDSQAKVTLAAAVAGGYVLGRTRKGRLALTGAALVMGRSLEPRQMLIEGVRQLRGVPAVAALGDQLRGEVYQAARDAAGAAVSRRFGSLTGGSHDEEQDEGAEDEDSAEDATDDEEDFAPEEAETEPDQDATAEEAEPEEPEEGEETGAAPSGRRERAGRGRTGDGTARKKKAPARSRKPAAEKPAAKKPAAKKSAPKPAARKSGGAGKATERRKTTGGRSSST